MPPALRSMKSTFYVTRYVSLFDTTPQRVEELTWSQLTRVLSDSLPSADKNAVPGFGAHVLTGPRRSAAFAKTVTFFVFDVDAGTPETNAATLSRLRSAGLAAHLYSSHSHVPEKPALRLIIPPTRHVADHEYRALRLHLIERFSIQCKPEQSSDTSRFWFLPSHKPGATPYAETLDGECFDVDLVDTSLLASRGTRRIPTTPLKDWTPPVAPASVDLKPYRDRLAKLSTRLRAKPLPSDNQRGTYLRRMLNGEALSDPGARNDVTTAVCGAVAFALPGASLAELMLLIRPSLNRMVNDGSKLTEDKVERMFLSAMRKKAEADHEENEINAFLAENKARLLSGE